MSAENIDLAASINNDLEKRIADTFDIFDHSGTKTVDVREVGTILRSLGCCPSEAEVQEVIALTEDHESPGSVRLNQFIPHVSQIITEHKFQPAEPEKLLEAFKTLDKENKGYLTKDYLGKLMLEEGEPFTEEELEEMLVVACDPHTGNIPYEYYINQLMYAPENNIYQLADEIEAAKPPPPTKKNFSELMAMAEGN